MQLLALFCLAAVASCLGLTLFRSWLDGHQPPEFVSSNNDYNDNDNVSFFPPHHSHRLRTPLRPVVGILTQPNEYGGEYISASYVKFVEASGARVVPVRYWWSDRELERVFRGVQGIVLPGGGASLDSEDSVMLRPVRTLYQLAERQNKKLPGSFFLFGICLGWELLAITATKDETILKESGQFDDPGVARALQHVDLKHSRLLRGLSPKLARQKLFFHSHQMGVTPEMFRLGFSRDRCWRVVALGEDGKGKKFVAAAESQCAPYYGVQFHPEKNLFEWKTGLDIPHSVEAVEVTHHFVRLVARLARQARPGSFTEQEIFARAIENVPVVTVGNSYYFQVYNFTKEEEVGEATTTTEVKI